MSWVSSVYEYTHECFTYRHHQVRRSSLGQARRGKGALGKVGQDGAHLSSSSPQGRGADTLLEQGAMGPCRPWRLSVQVSQGSCFCHWLVAHSLCVGVGPVWGSLPVRGPGEGPEVSLQHRGSQKSPMLPFITASLLDGLLPNTGAAGPNELAQVYTPKDGLLARCNLKGATLDGLFTSFPCRC